MKKEGRGHRHSVRHVPDAVSPKVRAGAPETAPPGGKSFRPVLIVGRSPHNHDLDRNIGVAASCVRTIDTQRP
jgi:hypothetical protein